MKKTLLTLLLLLPLLLFAQSPNDECATAIALTISTGTNCTTAIIDNADTATPSAPGSVCAIETAQDIWFSFTAINEKAVVTTDAVNSDDSNYYTFDVYEASCTTTPILCGGYNNYSLVSNLTIGQTYYLRVYNQWDTNVPFSICITTPATPITTSGTNYTIAELAGNLFGNSTDFVLSNITSSSAADFGPFNSLGSFDKNGSSFPLQSGVILSTGAIANAPGPNFYTQGTGFNMDWGGDEDLLEAIPVNGPGYQNATSLEFDFIPSVTDVGFNYIFASEEYGEFECFFSDAFAILLTDITDGTPAVNIAVIPGTTTPVAVTTVNNNPNNTQCDPVNPDYFAQLYSYQDITASINFNGYTVAMEASTNVIAGHTYHIKFVIADRVDTSYDSAIFLEASSTSVVIPAAPTGETTQTFIEGETLADLEVEGENIQWYATATGGTPLAKTLTVTMLTPLVDGATYYASQTIDDVESADRLAVTVTQVLGLHDNSIPGLSYFPNPVKNTFTINNSVEIDTVNVYNTVGQQVFTRALNTPEAILDFSALSNGIYFIKVTAGKNQQTIKVVKQ